MTDNTNIPELMHGIGEAAKDAARQLTTASTEAKKSSTFSLFCDKLLVRHDTMSWGHLEEGGE